MDLVPRPPKNSAAPIAGNSTTEIRPAPTSAVAVAWTMIPSCKPTWVATIRKLNDVAWRKPAANARRVPIVDR